MKKFKNQIIINLKNNINSKEHNKLFIRSCYLTKIIFYIKYLFIYYRFKQKIVKGQLERDEIPLDNSSAPITPILLRLKIRKEKFQKPNNI
jgi:hypothetical protein